jgi:hypothetical protein
MVYMTMGGPGTLHSIGRKLYVMLDTVESRRSPSKCVRMGSGSLPELE